jgi:hypothetical protein
MEQAQKELDQAHGQVVQVVNELSKDNPLLKVAGAGATVPPQQGGQPVQTLQFPPELAQKLEFAQKYLNNPFVQKYMKILTDPVIQKDVDVLAKHPRRMALLEWELGWVVLMFFFKAWRLTKSKGVMSMLFTQFWTFALFVFGILFLIPRLVIGEPYAQFVRDLIQVIQR